MHDKPGTVQRGAPMRANGPLQQADFLLVGSGLACATAAETLRTRGAEGSIMMLSAEQLPPYHHPPLSKRFLLGNENEAQLFIHPENFYRDRAIDLQLNTRVLSADPSRQTVTTAGGEIGYGQLLIATGGVSK